MSIIEAWTRNRENPRARATGQSLSKHMPKHDRAGEPKPAQNHETPRIVLLVGERLSVNAYSGSGLLLLRAGQVIGDAWQLARLLQPDTQFGEYRGIVMGKAPLTEGQMPLAAYLHDAYGRSGAAGQVRNSARDVAAEEAKALEQMPEVFQQAYATKSESIKQVRTVFDRIEASGELNIADMEQTVCSLVDQVASDGMATAAMTQLKDADAYTYCHSVNVCILAVYMALASGYQLEINYIGLGALLHDVGKLSIPMSVLRKKGPLDEQERGVVQQHPRQGLQLLQNAGCANAIVQSCVLDHHEKLTGGGYPRHKAACEISPYAKIISLADVFDALTTDRPYRRAMTARDALLLMVSDMNRNFDPWLLQRFVDLVGGMADKTYVTPQGHVALKEGPPETPVGQIIQAAGYIAGLDAVA